MASFYYRLCQVFPLLYYIISQVLALLYVKLYVYAYNLQQCCKNNLYSFVLCIVNCSKFVETKHK